MVHNSGSFLWNRSQVLDGLGLRKPPVFWNASVGCHRGERGLGAAAPRAPGGERPFKGGALVAVFFCRVVFLGWV